MSSKYPLRGEKWEEKLPKGFYPQQTDAFHDFLITGKMSTENFKHVSSAQQPFVFL